MTQYPQYPNGPEENPHRHLGGPQATRGSGTPKLGEAFRYGLNATFTYASFWVVLGVVCMAVFFIGGAIYGVVSWTIYGGGDLATGSTQPIQKTPSSAVGGYIMSVVFAACVSIGHILLSNAALRTVGGQAPTFASMFRVPNVRTVALVAIAEWALSAALSLINDVGRYFGTPEDMAAHTTVSGVSIAVQLVVGIIGLLIVPLTMYWVYVALEGNTNPGDCIRQGITIGKENYGVLLGYFLLTVILCIPAMLLCGLGMIIWFPAVLLAKAYLFRQITRGPLQPLQ